LKINILLKMNKYDTKEKRTDELIIANKELVYQNEEKEKRADELIIANKELVYQNEEKEKRAEELIIFNKEQVFRNEENEKLTIKLITTNIAQRRDITELKRAEQEIKIKNEELIKLNAEKDKFFSIIAHDLRSPFTGFLGITEIMVTDMDRFTLDDFRKFAGDLNLEANNLYRLLTNLLDWAKMQTGLTDFNPDKLSLKGIAEDCFQLFNERAKKKGIDMEEAIPEDIFVMADKSMLNTIIRNLISNALKYTRKGGRISISAKNLIDKVEISIKDTGIGMGEELIKNLFKIDKKTSRKGTDDEPSTRLGLLLCKEFIEKHTGLITVESKEGKGSEFVFSLPGGK